MGFFQELKLKRELRTYLGENNQNVYMKNKKESQVKRYVIWSVIILAVTLNIRQFGLTQVSIITSVVLLFVGVTFEIFQHNSKLRDRINMLKTEQEYMEDKVTSQFQAKENLKKLQIKHIILKDDEGYDLKTWKVEHLTSLIIGKKNPQNHVEIDLSSVMYSALISREHGILNKTEDGWFYEDLNSLNGSGIEKKESGRKVKIPKGQVMKVESGDYLYISNTKLLLE